MTKNKIKFGDLSAYLKVLVILGWIYTGFYALFFLIAFIIEFASVY